MGIIRGIQNYRLSRDYDTLWELAKEQSVVCQVDYYGTKDIAQTIHQCEPTVWTQVSARGMSYIWAEDKEEFSVICESVNLEWIVPESLMKVP